MDWFFIFRPALLLAALAFAGATQASQSLAPEITAQGFVLTETQEGELGAFGRIRVRFEVPGQIKELYIKERSYDVDLARTPEMAHFPLFGLKTQVLRLTDVTLDFQNYINEKIEEPGGYTFELRVIDREGNSASARLHIRVVAAAAAEQSGEEPVETSAFRFVRTGAMSEVSGADDFGITWKTVASDDVVIEVRKREGGASKLFEMAPSDYAEVGTRKELNHKLAGGNETPALHFATASGRAAGAVFGVINHGAPFLLKVTGSETGISDRGTTVTLVGEYKH